MVNSDYILNYKDWNVLTEAISPEDEAAEAPTPVTDILIKSAPLKHGSSKIKAVELAQTLLVNAGFLRGNSGPLKNGVDGDFGGGTLTALTNFLGKGYIDKSDADLLNTKIEDNKLEQDIVISSFNEYVAAKRKASGITTDQGILQDYYDKFYSKKSGFPTPSGNLNNDIVSYIYHKEGGMTDDQDDEGPAKNPMPFSYDSKNKKLKVNGKWINVTGNELPAITKSKVTGNYISNKWHTNRGIIWATWKSSTSGSLKDKAIGWLNVSKEKVSEKYFKLYYKKAISEHGETSSDLANHLLGLIRWGSGPKGLTWYINTYLKKQLDSVEVSTIDECISKYGERITLDLMIKARMNHFNAIVKSNSSKGKYLKGWSNSFLNFHQTFVNNYANSDSATSDDEFTKKTVDGKQVVHKTLPEVIVKGYRSNV